MEVGETIQDGLEGLGGSSYAIGGNNRASFCNSFCESGKSGISAERGAKITPGKAADDAGPTEGSAESVALPGPIDTMPRPMHQTRRV